MKAVPSGRILLKTARPLLSPILTMTVSKEDLQHILHKPHGLKDGGQISRLL